MDNLGCLGFLFQLKKNEKISAEEKYVPKRVIVLSLRMPW